MSGFDEAEECARLAEWIAWRRERIEGGNGTYRCPYCGYSSPHEHFIDRKGYVRGFSGEVLGRVTQKTDHYYSEPK